MKIAIGILLITLSSWARTAPTEAQNQENTMMSRLLEQIINTIDQSAIDMNVYGLSFDSKASRPVRTDKIEATGMVSFSGNWQVDLVNPKEGSKDSVQMKKVYPKIQADANKLILFVNLQMLPDSTIIESKFYSHYDNSTQEWVVRPLTIKMSNQMNKELFTIRLYSLHFEKKQDARNPEVEEIKGVCQSDKVLLDFKSGKNRSVPVD